MSIKQVIDDLERINRWAFERAEPLARAGSSAQRTSDLVEWARATRQQLRSIAEELEEKYPAERKRYELLLSEAALDLAYVERGTGPTSLRIGHILQSESNAIHQR